MVKDLINIYLIINVSVIEINSTLFLILMDKFNNGKALVFMGRNRLGITTLIEEYLTGKVHLFMNGNDSDKRKALEKEATQSYKRPLENTHWFLSMMRSVFPT